ncbi:MAG TPA: glycosyl hydrolase [Candidatus Polarisedimenticolia bacterium]|nr:glycosyl hydrolase [Candidatus Polarisedimenticolia bacterium]
MTSRGARERVAPGGSGLSGWLLIVMALAGLSTAAAPAVRAADEIPFDEDTFGGLTARSIGPAAMSGRISAVDAVMGDRLTIYAGAASGGVWKSVDGGLEFKPIFDKYNPSIGALVVDRKDPKIVWVGTGETWLRNSVSVGDGVYRSGDGGDNWEAVGLKDTERIARILVDPNDSNTVFVCATGHAFDANEERGVFRTKDAGKTWEKVLYVDRDTGCGDLAMDPNDGNILYAGMWQYRRLAYTFTSGGRGSGLYKSTDGGATWKKSQEGLPKADLGRIALAVAPSRPNIVFAVVEAKDATALYRSDDTGVSWQKLASPRAVTGRPFYFARLAVDPLDANRLYKMGFSASISEDGGKTFSPLRGTYHGDTHDIWIDPRHPDNIMMGTDGGLYQSWDRGFHWRFVEDLPVGQFYHVAYDMAWPYNVYGGLQDNASWYGPSRKSGGIQARDWTSALFCDGFWAVPDAKDDDFWYAECQGGWAFQIRKSTGEIRDIKPSPKSGEAKYRFNWNTPIHSSRAEPGVLFTGSQFLFRSKDMGASWERLSPDLTTNDPARLKQDESGGLTPDDSTAENHCTIFAIATSPKSKELIYVGTDDGNLQVTRDGGKTWTNVAAGIPGLPKKTWVSSIEASSFDEGTAYATFDGHMTGDMKTYVYRTKDYGKTWQALAGKGMRGYAHIVREDPVNQSLLFAGTELGLWLSLDGGGHWAQFKSGLPDVMSVRDIAIHPREHDLILATHGRSLYIVDDITPLRALTPQVLASDVAFLPTRPSVMPLASTDFNMFGDGEFRGDVPQEAASIVYYLRKRHIVGDLKLEISDASGNVITTLPGGKRKGLNRVAWPMRLPPPKFPPATQIVPFALSGPRVPAGTYNVKMIKGKDTYTTQVNLVHDPRSKYSDEDRKAQEEMGLKLYGLLAQMTRVVDSITEVRDQAGARAAGLPANDALRKRLETLQAGMEEQRKALVSVKEGEVVSGEEKLREELGGLYGAVILFEGRPTASQVTRMETLGKDLEAARAKYEAAVAKDVPPLNQQLASKKLEPITPLTEQAWKARQRS